MKKLTITILSILLIISCNNQNEEINIEENECLVQIADTWTLISLDQIPEYLDGGLEGFNLKALSEIRYPSQAREDGIEGIAIIEYEITIDGNVENINITQDPGTGLGNEAKRVLETITEGISFSPAILNNNPVRVKKEFQANFELE